MLETSLDHSFGTRFPCIRPLLAIDLDDETSCRKPLLSAVELARRPLSRVYVGLNDLRIDRGSNELFEPLVDGTVEYVRNCVRGPRFGVAGLTVPHLGSPVPSRLLAAELTTLKGLVVVEVGPLAET